MTRPDQSLGQNMCPNNTERLDQDLLLLAHGALPFWSSLRARAHLLRCAGCRGRVAQMGRTSEVAAAAVRGPALPPWSRAQAVVRAGRGRRTAVLAPVVLGLVLVVLLGVAGVLVLQHDTRTGVFTAPPDACAPAQPPHRAK